MPALSLKVEAAVATHTAVHRVELRLHQMFDAGLGGDGEGYRQFLES